MGMWNQRLSRPLRQITVTTLLYRGHNRYLRVSYHLSWTEIHTAELFPCPFLIFNMRKSLRRYFDSTHTAKCHHQGWRKLLFPGNNISVFLRELGFSQWRACGFFWTAIHNVSVFYSYYCVCAMCAYFFSITFFPIEFSWIKTYS